MIRTHFIYWYNAWRNTPTSSHLSEKTALLLINVFDWMVSSVQGFFWCKYTENEKETTKSYDLKFYHHGIPKGLKENSIMRYNNPNIWHPKFIWYSKLVIEYVCIYIYIHTCTRTHTLLFMCMCVSL